MGEGTLLVSLLSSAFSRLAVVTKIRLTLTKIPRLSTPDFVPLLHSYLRATRVQQQPSLWLASVLRSWDKNTQPQRLLQQHIYVLAKQKKREGKDFKMNDNSGLIVTCQMTKFTFFFFKPKLL